MEAADEIKINFIIGLWLGLKPAHAKLEEAKIIFYYGKQFDDNQMYSLEQARDILKHPNFDCNRKTVLYLHGYIETQQVESIHVIVGAYLKRGDHNTLVLDWGQLADGNYLLDAVQNIKEVKRNY